MHPRIQEVLAYLDAQRTTLRTAIDDMPPTLRAQRPASDRWSANEIVEHLVLVETRIGTLIEERLAAARAAGLGRDDETSPVADTFDLASVLDRGQTATASAATEPKGDMDTETAWDALTAKRDHLKEVILAADGLALGDIRLPNRRFGELNAYQWLLFLGAHEARHAAQIEEVMARLTAD